jgi:hypothetical protein
MNQENETKVYARSNFDLNKEVNTSNTPANNKIFHKTTSNY